MFGPRPIYVLPATSFGQPHTTTTHTERRDSHWHKVDSLLLLLLLLNETLVLLVRLVPVAVFLLRLEFIRQLLQNHRQQLLPPSLVLRVAVPHGDLYSVPANAVRNPAYVVVERYSSISTRYE
jgi:hypothetical protein